MLIDGIHHVRFAVSQPRRLATLFMRDFQFQVYAVQDEDVEDKSIVLKHQDVTFVICKRTSEHVPNAKITQSNANYEVDTVCDIAFNALNLLRDENIKRAENRDGFVEYKEIQSVVGNLQHSIIDVSNYNGAFLPGYKAVDGFEVPTKQHFTNVDHVAYAVHQGYTSNVLAWYKRTFQFERLQINENDDEEDGFTVQNGDMGLRLKAMHNKKRKQFPLKFVIAESASSKEMRSDQIKEFLEGHRGMGVQHIGLGTNDIIQATKYLKENGTNFILPPIEYYHNTDKRRQIENLELPLDNIEKCGIMVEADPVCNAENYLKSLGGNTGWYIMQVFTRPIFSEKTFFLELIQRYKTEAGFGAGNIEALWKSLQRHFTNNNVPIA